MTEHENDFSNSNHGEPGHDGIPAEQDHNAPQAEQDHNADVELDQVAKYRLKLEQTADLVARIRHEINNPLTGVLGQAQLLLREDLSERSRKRVQTIEDLALRLRDVVAQLREVQRPGGDGEGSD
ncbi:MAG TPA: histidine kinase dimerization/phospho-acceptor domain-containing protein [Pyrinomonadaceae bacterium]|nr:histidine kinase dimerization/phospho-acceptor domain-containing protein [Pyrinomonadaceae bacterium]